MEKNGCERINGVCKYLVNVSFIINSNQFCYTVPLNNNKNPNAYLYVQSVVELLS